MTGGNIAFQGIAGANSHIACATRYPDMTATPCATFEDVFAGLKSGAAALAMLPIENTVAGRVADIHRLLPDASVYIVGEHFMEVAHCLLGVSGASPDALTHVHSHEMALGQCRNVIAELGLDPITNADTAGAARLVAERGDATQAAIASPLAAEIYKLDILQENIEDSRRNITRFLIMSPTPDDVSIDAAPAIITSIVFRVRNVPAALYKALGGFASNGVNMTKLESYQPAGDFAATQFYADVEGHPDSPPVKLALEELGFFCSKLDILGVYPAAPERAALAALGENLD